MNMYYGPVIIGYDQNGFPIYQNNGYGYGQPMYPNQVQYPNQNGVNMYGQPMYPSQPNNPYQPNNYQDENKVRHGKKDARKESRQQALKGNKKTTSNRIDSDAKSETKPEKSTVSARKTKKTPHTNRTHRAAKIEEEIESKSRNNRGRPKVKLYDKPFEIQDDEEFNEVLQDANKLMRKTEGNLSEAQTTKIEKQLAILVEAMNNYKSKED